MIKSIYSVRFSSQLLNRFELFKFKNTVFETTPFWCFTFLFVKVFKNKTNCCSLRKVGTSPPLMLAMSQGSVLHWGVPQLQTISEDIYVFSNKHTLSLENNFVCFQSYLIRCSYHCISVLFVLVHFLVFNS